MNNFTNLNDYKVAIDEATNAALKLFDNLEPKVIGSVGEGVFYEEILENAIERNERLAHENNLVLTELGRLTDQIVNIRSYVGNEEVVRDLLILKELSYELSNAVYEIVNEKQIKDNKENETMNESQLFKKIEYLTRQRFYIEAEIAQFKFIKRFGMQAWVKKTEKIKGHFE